MKVSRTIKNVSIKDNNNIINYYINKHGSLTKLNAILVIDEKEKHFKSSIDFNTMLSSWTGHHTRMTSDILTMLENYDKIAYNSIYN